MGKNEYFLSALGGSHIFKLLFKSCKTKARARFHDSISNDGEDGKDDDDEDGGDFAKNAKLKTRSKGKTVSILPTFIYSFRFAARCVSNRFVLQFFAAFFVH